MAHVRTQIRNEFKDMLTDRLPTSENYVVFSSRKYMRNHIPETVIIDMRFLNDQTRQEETIREDKRIHVASLYIRVQRSAPEDEIDDLLDQDEVNIIKAISNHDWSELLEEYPELVQTNFSDADAGGHLIGSIVLRFDLEYRIEREEPEVIID